MDPQKVLALCREHAAAEAEYDVERVLATLVAQPRFEFFPLRKHITGRASIEKFYREVCLMEQAWVRDPNRTIKDLLGEHAGKLGEKIEVRRFVRFQLGEQLDGKAA